MNAPTATRRTLSWTDVEELEPVGTWRFVRYRGREYYVESPALAPDAVAAPPADGELRIAEPKVVTTYGTEERSTVTYRATLLAPGEYAAIVARHAPRRKREPVIAPVNVLRAGSRFGSRPGRVVGEGPLSAYAPGRPASFDFAALLRELVREGVTFVLTPGGRPVALSKDGKLLNDLVGPIVANERLIVAHVTGRPIRCDGWHAEAEVPAATVTTLFGVVLCAAHADGTLAIVMPGKERAA